MLAGLGGNAAAALCEPIGRKTTPSPAPSGISSRGHRACSVSKKTLPNSPKSRTYFLLFNIFLAPFFLCLFFPRQAAAAALGGPVYEAVSPGGGGGLCVRGTRRWPLSPLTGSAPGCRPLLPSPLHPALH